MKLPGVTYGSVQSLGRQDVTAPLRVANAEARATDSWNMAMNQGAQSFDEIVDMRAKDRTVKAMNAYNTEKLAWQATQEYYDENGQSAVDNGHERFNNADEAARSAASELLDNDARAQYYFTEAADKANVQYGDSWNRKVQTWHKDEQFGEATKAMELATQKRDFDTVDAIANDYAQRGVFTRVQTEKLISTNDANRVASSYNTQIEMSEGPSDFSNLRMTIQNEPKLTDKARKQYEEMLDNHIIGSYTDSLRQSMTIIEDEIGLEAAVVGGDAAIHEIAKMSEESETGFAEDGARQANRNAMRQVWQEWKSRLEKKTAGTKRRLDKQCAIDGTCLPTTGKTDDQKRYDDRLAGKLGWIEVGQTGYEKNGIETSVILGDDDTGHNYRRIMVGDFASSGYVAKATRETLDAAMTSNDPKFMRAGIQLFQQLDLVSPGSVVAKQAGIVGQYSDIIQAFDEDRALAVIQKGKALSPQEKGFMADEFDKSKLDDDGFEDVLAAKLPHIDGGFAYFDAAPKYQNVFKARVESRAKELMPLVGGDMDAAYTAAINSVSNTYNVDQITGQVVASPFATSLNHGNIGDGEWAHDIIKEGLPEFNKGEMPESYSYAPTPDFDPISNPSYVVSWVNEDNEFMAVHADLRFEETEQGREYFREANDREIEMARERQAQMEKDKAMSSNQAWEDAPLDVRVGVMKDQLTTKGGIVMNVIGHAQEAVWNKIGERAGVIGDKVKSLSEVELKGGSE